MSKNIYKLISDTDTNDIDNSSVTSESQSIDINSRNLNNNVSNDCDSPSIEIHTYSDVEHHFG